MDKFVLFKHFNLMTFGMLFSVHVLRPDANAWTHTQMSSLRPTQHNNLLLCMLDLLFKIV